LEDVQEYLEVFYHSCELGEYEVAFNVIRDGDDVNDFLNLRGNNQLRVELYQQLVENLPRREDWRYTASLTSLGNAYNALGRYPEAIAVLEQSLDIARDIGNRQGEANSLIGLGNAYHALGSYPEAIAFYKQSLDIQRDIGDKQGEADSLNNLGNAYNALGRYQEAIAVYEQSLDIKRDIGDRQGEADTLMNLGNSYQKVGRIQEGFAASQQATAIYQDLNLPIDAYPYPNWLKKLAKFAQRGKFHLILCFIGGLVALPFALIGLISVILYRLIRRRFTPS
jgi:tetratricopeptide (TPR) repeat protein